MEELEKKYRNERKALQAQITSLKKSAASGEGGKKKKREILEKIAQMELDLEKRHQQSVADLEQSLSTAQISPPTPDTQQLEPEPPVEASSAKPGAMAYKQTSLKPPSKQQRRREKKQAELDRIKSQAASEEPLVDRRKLERDDLEKVLKPLNFTIHEASRQVSQNHLIKPTHPCYLD